MLIAGAALGGYVLTSSSMDRRAADAGVQTDTQTRSLARDAAEAAHAVVAGELIDPATDRFRTVTSFASAMPQRFEAGGGRARIENYVSDGRTATVTVAARVGQKAHRITSTYEIRPADWPGPFVVESPYLVAFSDDDSEVTASGPSSDLARGVYVGTGRFDEYRLGSVLNPAVRDSALQVGLAPAEAALFVKNGEEMADVYGEFNTPQARDLWAAATRRPDVSRSGGYRVNGVDRYGNFGDPLNPDPKVVYVSGDLDVPYGSTLEGNGVLAVSGDVRVKGRLRWEGLVLIVPPSESQHVEVDLEGQEATIRGSVIVDQEAPPPGGHTDLTVFRDLDHGWSHPAGDGGRPGGKPAAPAAHSGPDDEEYHYQHTHRIDQPHNLGHRRFVFDAVGPRQQRYTRFRETIQALLARPEYNAGTAVVLEFSNAGADGAALFELNLTDQAPKVGTVRTGFLGFVGESSHVTEPFDLGDFESLVVDVKSLRMLERLKNRAVSDSPFCDEEWRTAPFDANCLIENRVAALSHLRDRDGALTIRLALADGSAEPSTKDRALYEASLYWHTKSPGHSQYRQEEEADREWREAIQRGEAEYGSELHLGANAAVHLDLGHVHTAMTRLGLANLIVAHVGSRGEAIEFTDMERAEP